MQSCTEKQAEEGCPPTDHKVAVFSNSIFGRYIIAPTIRTVIYILKKIAQLFHYSAPQARRKQIQHSLEYPDRRLLSPQKRRRAGFMVRVWRFISDVLGMTTLPKDVSAQQRDGENGHPLLRKRPSKKRKCDQDSCYIESNPADPFCMVFDLEDYDEEADQTYKPGNESVDSLEYHEGDAVQEPEMEVIMTTVIPKIICDEELQPSDTDSVVSGTEVFYQIGLDKESVDAAAAASSGSHKDGEHNNDGEPDSDTDSGMDAAEESAAPTESERSAAQAPKSLATISGEVARASMELDGALKVAPVLNGEDVNHNLEKVKSDGVEHDGVTAPKVKTMMKMEVLHQTEMPAAAATGGATDGDVPEKGVEHDGVTAPKVKSMMKMEMLHQTEMPAAAAAAATDGDVPEKDEDNAVAGVKSIPA